MHSPSSHPSQDRLVALMSELCEGTLDADAELELESLVISNREMRRLYVRYMFLHYRLHQDFSQPIPQENLLLVSAVEDAIGEYSPLGTLQLVQPPATKRFKKRHLAASTLGVA